MRTVHWFTILSSCGCLLISGCGEGSTGSRDHTETAARVQIAQAQPTTVPQLIQVTGTLFADEAVVLSAKVPGRVHAIHKDLGDTVLGGEALATIDPTDYELEVRQRRLAVQATLAKLGLDDFPPDNFDPAQVPTVQRASLQLANAKDRFERLRALFEQTPPLISEQEFADAQTAFEVASSDFDVQVMEARALLAEAATRQAEFDAAQQRLTDTGVTAPLDIKSEDQAPRSFIVAERMIAVGQYVREGDSLFRLVDHSLIKLRAMVPERYVGKIQPDLPVAVNVQAYPHPFQGHVSRVSPQIDPANRTFPVEVVIVNHDGRLKPGQFASAAIELPQHQPAILVPTAAISSFAGVDRLFIVRDSRALEVRVKLGDRRDDQQLIEPADNLIGGEQVILDPPSTLVSGTPIDIIPAQANAADQTTRPHRIANP